MRKRIYQDEIGKEKGGRGLREGLPRGWAEGKLDEIVFSVRTGVQEYKGEKEYYSTGSIKNNIYISEGFYIFNKKPSRANRLSKLNDVFQARMKETDKALIINERFSEQLFSTGFFQLRPYGETYHPKLLYYFVKSHDFLNQRDRLCTGSTQEALTDTKAKELIFPIPPINEQKRITAELDCIIPKINSVKERLDRIQKIIKLFRQSVLTAVVTGKLTEKWRVEHPEMESAGVLLTRIKEERARIWKRKKIRWKDPCSAYIEKPTILPLSWAFVSIEEILSEPMANGRSVIDGNGYPVLRLTALKNGFIDINERKKGAWGKAEAKKFFIKKGDFLISRGNGSLQLVGRGGLVLKEPDDIAYPDTLIRIRVIQLILEEFLRIVWDSDIIRTQIETLAHTTAGIHKVSQKDIGKCGIPVPPLSEQHEIVRQVDRLFAFADKLEKHYKKTKEIIDKLPQSVLAEAFRGELVPQDPNDEPAEKLLERIRQEKERLNATRAGKKKNSPQRNK